MDALESHTAKVIVKLKPTIRCVALVGYFLQFWSVIESTLNRAIEEALDLDALQGAVVTKNIQLRDKINILKTLVDLHGREVDRYKKALNAISALSTDRNMIAHDMFLADDQGDGVQFIVVKSKRQARVPSNKVVNCAILRKVHRNGKTQPRSGEHAKRADARHAHEPFAERVGLHFSTKWARDLRSPVPPASRISAFEPDSSQSRNKQRKSSKS